MVTAIEKKEIVLFKGKKYTKEVSDTEIILTSLEVKKGYKQTVLTFTRDTEMSRKTEFTVTSMIKKAIISSYFNG